jgi:hypothetical protein
MPLRIPADREVVNVVSMIAGHPSGEAGPLLSVPSAQPINMESPIDDFTSEPGEQVDHETDEALQSPSHGLELLWSGNETDDEHESCMDPTTELDSHVPMDDTTGGAIATHQISSDPSIEFGAPLQPNKEIDSQSRANNTSGTVNLGRFCARIVALVRSILASAIGRSHPNHRLISSLHRIRVPMTRLLILYRISREGSSQHQNPSDDSLLSIVGIGVTSVQEEVEAYFAPLQDGEKLLQRFMQTLPNRSMMFLHRLEDSNRERSKPCHLIQSEPSIDLTALTELKCCPALHDPTGLTSYI